jgi:hypothetical protein
MPNSCKSHNLSAVKPTKFYDTIFKENIPLQPKCDDSVFKENISPRPGIQERVELFPGLVNVIDKGCGCQDCTDVSEFDDAYNRYDELFSFYPTW